VGARRRRAPSERRAILFSFCFSFCFSFSFCFLHVYLFALILVLFSFSIPCVWLRVCLPRRVLLLLICRLAPPQEKSDVFFMIC